MGGDEWGREKVDFAIRDRRPCRRQLSFLFCVSYIPISFYQETVDIALICIPAVGYSLNFVARVLVLHLHHPNFRFRRFLLENRK